MILKRFAPFLEINLSKHSESKIVFYKRIPHQDINRRETLSQAHLGSGMFSTLMILWSLIFSGSRFMFRGIVVFTSVIWWTDPKTT